MKHVKHGSIHVPFTVAVLALLTAMPAAAEDPIVSPPRPYAVVDTESVPVAAIDKTKTQADLDALAKVSPLDAETYLGAGGVAQRTVANMPLATNSSAIAAYAPTIPSRYGSAAYGITTSTNSTAYNIPIYLVDSSDPYQNFVEFYSTDARVTTYAKLSEMTMGRIPLPAWARPAQGRDSSLAIYDVATGIWRSYFHTSYDATLGKWTYASAGYMRGLPGMTPLAAANYADNFWLGLAQGTSSVVGMANELTQVGIKEAVAGQINHAVSVTCPSTLNMEPSNPARPNGWTASFPAKDSDGKDPSADAPAEGQWFRIDPKLNIDATTYNPFTKILMKAIQKYGGYCADTNAWSYAFNLESPFGHNSTVDPWYGYGEVAVKWGIGHYNQYRNLGVNDFPWSITQWAPIGWSQRSVDSVPTPKTQPVPQKYATCAAAQAVGDAPLIRGREGYSASLDPDGDGVACEWPTQVVDGVKYQVVPTAYGRLVYSKPGYFLVNGRRWRTTCGQYTSAITRCRTEIFATVLVPSGTTYVQTAGWAFNNFSYLPVPRALWGTDPLAHTGTFTSSGRQWKTSCGDEWTGPNACRTFIWGTVISRDASGNFVKVNQWLYNNVVYFTPET